jgi:cytochrome c peroxidase
VTHAGTHEVSVIQFPELVAKLRKLPHETHAGSNAAFIGARRSDTPYLVGPEVADVPNDLAFLVGLRQRIKLKGNGPRCLVVVSNTAWVGSYFSDTLQPLDLTSGRADKPSLALQPAPQISDRRRGEMLFNDASICFQQWQSCGSCHSEDGRVDGLNWDLLNDGVGNPKNTKSLLLAHQTPPAMSTGVRETAETAVRAGIQHILFSVQPEAVALALDTWLKSLAPLPSPHLVSSGLSAAARRGQRLFQSARVGCAGCHPAPLWTNLRQYDVGTAGAFDREGEPFDTPSLVELWRTAPYLHDGSAASLRDVLIRRNARDRHGRTSDLSNDQIEDLIQYLLSL